MCPASRNAEEYWFVGTGNSQKRINFAVELKETFFCSCKVNCATSCPPCTEKCDNRCQHSKCAKKCSEPCVSCKEQCGWRCDHYKCSRRCSEPCDRPRCDEPCSKKIVKCGHPCVGLCGELCPPLCCICDLGELTKPMLSMCEDDPDAR